MTDTVSRNQAVDTIFAYLAEDDAGKEGIIIFPVPGFGVMPLVTVDEARVPSMMSMAKTVATKRGRAVELVKFTVRTSIRTLKPGKRQEEAPQAPQSPPAPSVVDVPFKSFSEPQLSTEELIDTDGVFVAAGLAGDAGPAIIVSFRTDDGWVRGYRITGVHRDNFVKLVNAAAKQLGETSN